MIGLSLARPTFSARTDKLIDSILLMCEMELLCLLDVTGYFPALPKN